MKFIKTAVLSVIIMAVPFIVSAQHAKFKCMVQMDNYMGDGAYIAISLINPKGQYEKTLYVIGADKKWYKSLKSWYKFYSKKSSGLNAVTGASISGGDRTMKVLELDESKFNKGYSIRFESAVEDKKYYEQDAEIPLTSEGLSGKTNGKGYIKYVRFSKVK